jgi:hypothetical protein
MPFMDSHSSMKINRLLQAWPRGTVALHAFMLQHGVSRKLAEQYRKRGWIDAVGRGAFIRRGDKVGWEGAVYAVQSYAHKPFRPGGRTALEIYGLGHFLRHGARRQVHLYGPAGQRLPRWLTEHDWGADLRYFSSSLFPEPAGVSEKAFGEFNLSVSSPERAILEVMDGVPKHIAFDEAMKLVEGLPSLRPGLMQALMESCRSVKV